MKKKKIRNSLHKLQFNEDLQKLNWYRRFDKYLKAVHKFVNRRSAMSYEELERAVENRVKINSMKDLFNG